MYFIFAPPLNWFFLYICFSGLKWFLGIFRKSQEVWVLNFDHKWVKYVNIYFVGPYGPTLCWVGLTDFLFVLMFVDTSFALTLIISCVSSARRDLVPNSVCLCQLFSKPIKKYQGWSRGSSVIHVWFNYASNIL
jgi:hypothetical protein